MHFYRRFFLREHHTDNLVGEPVVIENVEIFGEISIQNLEIYSIRGILSDSRRLVSSIFEFFSIFSISLSHYLVICCNSYA